MDRTLLIKKVTDWIGKYKYLLLILLIGVVLMLLPDSTTEHKQEETIQQLQITSENLPEELAEVLSNIKGAGRVQVMITTEKGKETVYQTDISSGDKENTVIISNADRNENGLVQQVISPVYRGAIILCQGADNASVKLSIIDAVSKVTGLDSSQISVLKMK